MTESPYFATGTADNATIGVRLGHWTDDGAATGCTVIRFDAPARCVVDVRGGAPATRETALLAPGRLVRQVDAILLTGGSAFGLAAADGVMRALREDGRGVATSGGPVPIVPAAAIFDLVAGPPRHPDAEAGYAAVRAVTELSTARWGAIGAGRGATIDKITGTPRPGGIGLGVATWAEGWVRAIAVVNALGVVTTTEHPFLDPDPRLALLAPGTPTPDSGNTTLVVLLIDAPIAEDDLVRSAISAHDGMARAIVPCHTVFDGDIVFATALRPLAPRRAPTLALAAASELAVERAIRAAVGR